MRKKGARPEEILPSLAEKGGVLGGSVREVSRETGVPEAEVWGAGTFYGLLAEPGERVRVCGGLSCHLAGTDRLCDDLRAEGHTVEQVSCLGRCDQAPAALDPSLELLSGVEPGRVLPADRELPIDLGGPDYGGYTALERARDLGPAAVIDLVEAAGLQGRGGAAFPAHLKWRAVRAARDATRYLVVNADEGEPGTFKDREVMLRRPHRLLEGAAIAAEAVGAREIVLYLRGEFLDCARSLERALEEALPALAGLTLHLHLGHGAYICGEETALLESLEGRRGEPRLKPPFPTEAGLRGRPTLIHNVETLACLPFVLTEGGEAFRALGRTEPGTKLYCASGAVKRPGVYELPLGVTLDELVEAAGGYRGTPRAFSPGGASSGFLPMRERGRPLDVKHLAEVGSMLGSAGVVVLPDTVDLLEAARVQLAFFAAESCGQCAPCRIGTRFLLQAATRFAGGEAAALAHAGDVAWEMAEGSICGLGMSAASPLTSLQRHFPELFEGGEG
ncbi:MAG: NADH-ubiquinone oxidoreductase-F iron-sulfur binding region domain-containing protein [Deltaproteobacteria bacterium]|nr:NADH-ubiquinone oxidoreductase-F iron-sulfur binding region domain-containing protein [Deltaproteobacteria bacterium]